MHVVTRDGERGKNIISPMRHDHSTIPSPSLFHPARGTHMHTPHIYFEPPGLGFKLFSQPYRIQLPKPTGHRAGPIFSSLLLKIESVNTILGSLVHFSSFFHMKENFDERINVNNTNIIVHIKQTKE